MSTYVDLGDTAALQVTTRDSTGALVNVGTVTCTVTLPDATLATPTVTNGSTGSYTASYPTTLAGRHTIRWTATGANAFAHTDVLDVAPATPTAFVSMDDVKAQLNITDTASDDELRLYIDTACDEVEQWVGPIVQRQVVGEFVDLIGRTIFNELTTAGSRTFVVRNRPIISLDAITSALLAGVTYTTTDFNVDSATGICRRNDGGTIYGPLLVTYTVGRPVVPAWAQLAAKIIVQHMWKSQRAPSNAQAGWGNRGGDDDSELVAGIGFMIPRFAAEMLESHRQTPAIG